MDIVSYSFNSIQVRTQLTENGEPLFCLADICKVLDGNQPNKVAEAIREEFGCTELNSAHVVDTLGREQEATFVTEPQLYFVLMRSRSDNARPFRQWVVNDVLPAIRKTGRYEVKPVNPLAQQLEVAKFILDVAGITGNQQAISLDNLVKAKTGESMLALTGTRLVAPQAKQLLTPTQLGEPLGLSAIKVNKRLEALGLQFKTEAGWQPTDAGLAKGAVMLDTGKRHSSGVPVRQLKWPADILQEC